MGIISSAMLHSWEEMQAENERLKALCDTYRTCYQAKHSDIKGLLFKYKQTLQEIKKILLQAMDVKSNAYNHFLKVEQAIDLITKAESEGE